jgi:hypothetical protein
LQWLSIKCLVYIHEDRDLGWVLKVFIGIMNVQG